MSISAASAALIMTYHRLNIGRVSNSFRMIRPPVSLHSRVPCLAQRASRWLADNNFLKFNFENRLWTFLFLLATYLTVTVRAGSRLPKSSKMVIMAEMSKIAQKYLKRLPLKFKDESFDAIKCSKKIRRKWTEKWPEMKFFRPRIELFGTFFLAVHCHLVPRVV